MDAGGLDRAVTATRLPDRLTQCAMTVDTTVDLVPDRGTPIWARVKTEDGHTARSNPVYVIPN